MENGNYGEFNWNYSGQNFAGNGGGNGGYGSGSGTQWMHSNQAAYGNPQVGMLPNNPFSQGVMDEMSRYGNSGHQMNVPAAGQRLQGGYAAEMSRNGLNSPSSGRGHGHGHGNGQGHGQGQGQGGYNGSWF